MKIYIIGAVSSGKTTLAKKISACLGVPYFSLDDLVHLPDTNENIGRRRSDKERESLFNKILSQPSYILEDVGRQCFYEGVKQADLIIYLDLPKVQLYKRATLRWIKQRMKLEKTNYLPTRNMLLSMFKWIKNSSNEAITPFVDKTISLHNETEIDIFLKNLTTSR